MRRITVRNLSCLLKASLLLFYGSILIRHAETSIINAPQKSALRTLLKRDLSYHLAHFNELLKQRIYGNSVPQCPCVVKPGTKKCITYDSRFQAASIEEAILAFPDVSADPRNLEESIGGPINAESFSCRTLECRTCVALLVPRLVSVGLLQSKSDIAIAMPSVVDSRNCRRFRFANPPPSYNPPPLVPEYIKKMIDEGRRYAAAMSATSTVLHKRSRISRPRHAAQRDSDSQRQQRQMQTNLPQQKHNQQQWKPKLYQQQGVQSTYFPIQQPQPYQTTQSINPMPHAEMWSPQFYPSQPSPSVSLIPPVVYPPMRPFPPPEWNQPRLPQQSYYPPFMRPFWQPPFTPVGPSGGNEIQPRFFFRNHGIDLLGTGGAFRRYSKRETKADEILGERFDIACINRGEVESEETVLMNLCSVCWTWRQLPEDYFPRLVNELLCKEESDSTCLSGWGSCHQRFRNVDVLKKIGGKWETTTISIANCCDCKVKAGTEAHALVIS